MKKSRVAKKDELEYLVDFPMLETSYWTLIKIYELSTINAFTNADQNANLQE